MKRLRVGSKVRLADPSAIACRFWDSGRGCIMGAGGAPVHREMLDEIGVVAMLADRCNGARGCVTFDMVRNGQRIEASLWLDAEALVPAFTMWRKAATA